MWQHIACELRGSSAATSLPACILSSPSHPAAVAPEVQRCPLKLHASDNKDNVDLAYDMSCDVYSLGLMTLELLTGGACSGNRDGLAMAKQLQGIAAAGGVTEAAVHFVLECLPESPRDRPTAMQLMEHRWLRNMAAASAPAAQ